MRRYGILLPLLLALAGALATLASAPSPRKARLFLLQGMQREVQGDLPGAYALYRHALTADPTDRLASYKAGMLETLRGDSASVAQGLGAMREYVEAYPADYYEAFTYANLRARTGDHAEAYRVVRRLHSLYPQNTELLNTLAELAMYLQMPDTALEYLSQEERVEGHSTYLTTCKMMAHLSRGDTAATLREADEALRRNPADPDYYILKGGVLENFTRQGLRPPLLRAGRLPVPRQMERETRPGHALRGGRRLGSHATGHAPGHACRRRRPGRENRDVHRIRGTYAHGGQGHSSGRPTHGGT